MPPLDRGQGRALLELARRSVTEAAALGRAAAIAVPASLEDPPAGVFVTLRQRGRLRGCIGCLGPLETLAASVVRCAASAAVEDPRFARVRSEEVPGLEIEISMLSAPQRASPGGIRVGEHGLLVTRGGLRGLLLPQVAIQYHWTAERFLEETCAKAGLERDAWRNPATRIETFTAEVISEAEFCGEQKARAG